MLQSLVKDTAASLLEVKLQKAKETIKHLRSELQEAKSIPLKENRMDLKKGTKQINYPDKDDETNHHDYYSLQAHLREGTDHLVTVRVIQRVLEINLYFYQETFQLLLSLLFCCECYKHLLSHVSLDLMATNLFIGSHGANSIIVLLYFVSN